MAAMVAIDGSSDDALAEAARTWRTRGWVLIPSLVPTEEIDVAQDDLWTMYPPPEVFHSGAPDPRVDEFRTRRDPDYLPRNEPPTGPAFRVDQFLGTRSFPFPGPGKLNRLAVHRRIVAFARAAFETDDIRLYQAQAWAKYTGVTDYEQALHCDDNHSLIPSLNQGPFVQLEGFLYLSDVLEACDGPVRIKDVGASEDDEGVLVTGPRGSFLAYRPDVRHRATNITGEGGSRFVAAFAYRRAEAEWGGYTTFGSLATNGWFKRFVAGSTPDELSLFGIPRPGHPIWNDAMIDAFAAMYRGLDTEPWRAALRSAAAAR